MRQKAKRDQNEAEIVAALEAIGVVCYRVSSPSIPDLLTWHRGRWLPIEVKRKGGKLTKAQEHSRARALFPIVESVSEAVALFGVTRHGMGADATTAQALRQRLLADVENRVCYLRDSLRQIGGSVSVNRYYLEKVVRTLKHAAVALTADCPVCGCRPEETEATLLDRMAEILAREPLSLPAPPVVAPGHTET